MPTAKVLRTPGSIWLSLPREECLEIGSMPLALVAFSEVSRTVLGVPLCMWQTSPCTFVYVPADQAYFTSLVDACMRSKIRPSQPQTVGHKTDSLGHCDQAKVSEAGQPR